MGYARNPGAPGPQGEVFFLMQKVRLEGGSKEKILPFCILLLFFFFPFLLIFFEKMRSSLATLPYLTMGGPWAPMCEKYKKKNAKMHGKYKNAFLREIPKFFDLSASRQRFCFSKKSPPPLGAQGGSLGYPGVPRGT